METTKYNISAVSADSINLTSNKFTLFDTTDWVVHTSISGNNCQLGTSKSGDVITGCSAYQKQKINDDLTIWYCIKAFKGKPVLWISGIVFPYLLKNTNAYALTAEETKTAILILINHIIQAGIIVEPQDLNLRRLDLSQSYPLDNDINEYMRHFKNFPYTKYGKLTCEEDGIRLKTPDCTLSVHNKITAFERKNNGKEKTADLPENLLRIEIKHLSKSQVIKALNIKNLLDLYINYHDLANYYRVKACSFIDRAFPTNKNVKQVINQHRDQNDGIKLFSIFEQEAIQTQNPVIDILKYAGIIFLLRTFNGDSSSLLNRFNNLFDKNYHRRTRFRRKDKLIKLLSEAIELERLLINTNYSDLKTELMHKVNTIFWDF